MAKITLELKKNYSIITFALITRYLIDNMEYLLMRVRQIKIYWVSKKKKSLVKLIFYKTKVNKSLSTHTNFVLLKLVEFSVYYGSTKYHQNSINIRILFHRIELYYALFMKNTQQNLILIRFK